jgi:hypothetical protein
MRTKVKHSIYIIIGLLSMSILSCIDDVDNINLPDSSPKLVVLSFISPGDSIRVSVRPSKPLNYNLPQQGDSWEFDYVENALVVIKNTSTEADIVIPYDPMLRQYVLSPLVFAIEKGEEYQIEVSAPNFRSVTATTVVPSTLTTVTDLKLDSTNFSEWGGFSIFVSGSINDVPNERNYYSVSSFRYETYTWEEYTERYLSTYSRILLTDTDRDGEKVNFRNELYVWENNGEINVLVASVDVHYYKFHKSIENISDFDNPFSESTHLYSNITGGLGVFASYLTITHDIFNR